jgi:hypothetical protein
MVNGIHIPPIPLVQAVFDLNMDTGVLPALASFEVVIDGIPQTPLTRAWFSSTVLDLGITGSASTSAVIKLLTVDSLLRSDTGVVATAPQEVVAFP